MTGTPPPVTRATGAERANMSPPLAFRWARPVLTTAIANPTGARTAEAGRRVGNRFCPADPMKLDSGRPLVSSLRRSSSSRRRKPRCCGKNGGCTRNFRGPRLFVEKRESRQIKSLQETTKLCNAALAIGSKDGRQIQRVSNGPRRLSRLWLNLSGSPTLLIETVTVRSAVLHGVHRAGRRKPVQRRATAHMPCKT